MMKDVRIFREHLLPPSVLPSGEQRYEISNTIGTFPREVTPLFLFSDVSFFFFFSFGKFPPPPLPPAIRDGACTPLFFFLPGRAPHSEFNFFFPRFFFLDSACWQLFFPDGPAHRFFSLLSGPLTCRFFLVGRFSPPLFFLARKTPFLFSPR